MAQVVPPTCTAPWQGIADSKGITKGSEMVFEGRERKRQHQIEGERWEGQEKWTQWDRDREELKYPYSTPSKISNHQRTSSALPSGKPQQLPCKAGTAAFI